MNRSITTIDPRSRVKEIKISGNISYSVKINLPDRRPNGCDNGIFAEWMKHVRNIPYRSYYDHGYPFRDPKNIYWINYNRNLTHESNLHYWNIKKEGPPPKKQWWDVIFIFPTWILAHTFLEGYEKSCKDYRDNKKYKYPIAVSAIMSNATSQLKDKQKKEYERNNLKSIQYQCEKSMWYFYARQRYLFDNLTRPAFYRDPFLDRLKDVMIPPLELFKEFLEKGIAETDDESEIKNRVSFPAFRCPEIF